MADVRGHHHRLTHGCIGLYFWLRMKAFYQRAAPFLLAFAVLVPTLALLGLYQGGRSVVESDSVEWRAENLTPDRVGTLAEQAVLSRIEDYFLIGYLGLLGLVLLARGVRALNERRAGMNQSELRQRPDGARAQRPQRARGKPAQQRAACQRLRRPRALLHLPHSRDRGLRGAPEPSKREAFVLNRVGAGSDPAIRLACQLRPETDLSFFQIFLPQITAASLRTSSPSRIGEERYLVSMFVDMRGSTKLAEKRLPFDTVFIVNRFLGAVSQAVLESGGQPNQFRRRRATGAVRARLDAANRLPPGAESGGDDRGQCRGIKSLPGA